MASKRYCRSCDRKVMAVYSYTQVPAWMTVLVLCTFGLALPLVMMLPKSRYVCPICCEDV